MNKQGVALVSSGKIYITFHGDTADLLRRDAESDATLAYPLNRRASIKDIVESLGLPHTDIGAIVRDGEEQMFTLIPDDGDHVDIHPHSPAFPPTTSTTLRPNALPHCKFLVDRNIGRLTGLLRMAGCNAESVSDRMINGEVVEMAVTDNRIMLTRNRDLLKQRKLVFGRLVRSQNPEQQLREIVNLYNLRDQLRPFSRCISCNGTLEKVEKDTIISQLLPLTIQYYNRFKQCTKCAKIYWHGSHRDSMTAKLRRILQTE